MKANTPKSVMALGGKFAYPNDASETPDTLQTVYEYDGFSILWEHATGISNGNYGRNHGISFIGNKGTLVLDRNGWEVIAEKDEIQSVPLQQNQGSGLDKHTNNFIEAVKSRDASILKAPLKIGYDAALVCHMGNIAFKTGNRIYWDNYAGVFTDEKSNALINAQYHNGWELPKG